MKFDSIALGLILAAVATTSQAGQSTMLRSPEPNVLCDRFVCANSNGLSQELTEKFIGKKAAGRLAARSHFTTTEFTFSNGVFCDVNERVCRADRYFGAGGKRSGAILDDYTKKLFGQ